MDARLDLFTNPVATKFIKHINAASQVARTAGVPLDTLELMALRAERAALELAEEGTRLADGSRGVSDAVWENAAKHYTEEQLVALIATIAIMNTWNRLNIITQQPAGDYVPGQWG